MKYKLLKELPGILIGTELISINGAKLIWFKFEGANFDFTISEKDIIKFPDWFEPIDEKAEEIEKAKKLLTESGYFVGKLSSTGGSSAYTTDKVQIPVHNFETGCDTCKPSWNTLHMKPEYTIPYLLEECKKLFPVNVSSWINLDDLKSDRHGEYTITYKPNIEADEENKNKSANSLTGQQITLEERLLLEIQYFKETGRHLDIDYKTLCVGSRDRNGDVPTVDWRDCQLHVDYYDPDDASGDVRSRTAVPS